MSFVFEWNKFFNYYTSEVNLHVLKVPVELSFYVQINKYKGEWKEITTYSKYMMALDDVNVYITYNQDGWIFFNVLRVQNKKNLGDHMTIGLKDKKSGLIDLHYTVQNTQLHQSEKKICFLKDSMTIHDFDQIVCANPRGKQMKDHFTPEQLNIMEQIIKMPFIISAKGGSMKKKHLYHVCKLLNLEEKYKFNTKKELQQLVLKPSLKSTY